MDLVVSYRRAGRWTGCYPSVSLATPAPDTRVLAGLDDDVVQFALRPFLCTARRLKLDVASPAIMGEVHRPPWGLMQRRASP